MSDSIIHFNSRLHGLGRFFSRSAVCVSAVILAATPLRAAEETGFSWPLGPIGGKFRIWTDATYIRVSELTAGAPGATAGLQTGDFITGAFGRSFDAIGGSKFNGPVRQLSEAIDFAEINNTPLVLNVTRPGSGTLAINVNLPSSAGLTANYTRTSTRYSALYETACAALHTRIMGTSNGDIGYPTGFAGLALLGHANWNDTTGAKPYRLSVNKVRDWAISYINSAQLTPQEDKYLDGTANPTYAGTGLENWTLGQAVMFFSEYVTKTGEFATYQATLQRGAVMMANRIQHWKQPAAGGSANLSYEETRGATGHGGVTGDYTHQWYVGINMAGLHLFNGLAMAKRAGADMTERPKDAHYFGYNLTPGDPIPATITDAVPATITLPRGAQDTRNLPQIDNISAAPLTKITTVDGTNNPFYYDLSLDQKFWMQWDCLTRSSSSEGWVAYASVTGAAYDAGGRTPASLVAMKIYQNGAALGALDQDLTDRQMNYIVNAHDIHLNAHAYNMGGSCFTALLMPYMSDRDQRYFLENWKFYYNLAGQPDGSIRYFRGRDFTDNYINETDAMHTNIALAGSVARGGLPHVPGFDTSRIMARVRQPLMDWPTRDARRLRLPAGVTSTSLDLDLLDGTGAVIPPAGITAAWSVVSGPVTSGVITTPNALDTTANFPQPGTYRLRLDASSGALSTYELIDVQVLASPIAGYVMGEADYKVYTDIGGSAVANLTSAAKYPNTPDISRTLTQLQGNHGGDNYGSTITCVVVPPVTGNYRFYIASDDSSELRFNSGGPSASGATIIASVNGWTNALQWNKYSSQQSAVIALTAGQPYYLQALQKEGGGGDNLAIGWTTPSNATITVIGAESIARSDLNGTPSIVTHPADQAVAMGGTLNLTMTVNGPEPRFFQWRRNGVNFGSPQGSPAFSVSNVGAGLAGQWDCVYTCGNSVITSQSATVTVTGAGVLTAGGLWQEVYNNIGGGNVSDLLASPNYPLLPTSSGVLAEPATSSLADDYGQRWTGWLIPSVSGRYRFYAAADDTARLYLSPSPYESHKQLIHSVTSYTGEKDWSARSPSDWIQLEAGQRYYVEFLHKEGGGGDHAAFTWQREGDPVPTNGGGLIPSANLQYATGGTQPDAATAPPFAQADALSVILGSSTTLDVAANDLDANPASLVVDSFTQPASGTVTQNGNQLTYTPTPGAPSSDSFTYTVRNGLNLTSTATVSVTLIDPANGITAWWKLNEGSGTSAADSSGNGHSATLTSGTTWSAGKLGSAITLSSNSHKAQTAAGKPVPGTFSITAWMKPTDTTGIDTIFSFGSTAAFRTNGSGMRFTTFGVKDHNTASGLFTANVWTHVALTFTPSATGGAKFYVNGTLQGSIDSSSINTTATGAWIIGGRSTATEGFVGSLDDVRLYNRVITQSELQVLAQGNAAPVFASNPIQLNATEDSAFTGQLVASDMDADDTLTYSKVSGPAWLTVSATGALSGTPDNSHVGVNAFTVRVTDGTVNTDATLNVTVANTNDAPVWSANPVNLAATEDAAFTGQLSASDVDAGDTLAYSKVSGPSWLTVSTTGVLSGTPSNSDVGANAFTVRVTDGTVNVDATLNITVANVNDAPVWATNPIVRSNATEGVAYTGQTLASEAGDVDSGDSLTYGKVSGPAWLVVASNGMLSGTPSFSDVGSNAFTVSVSDGTVAVNATLNLVVDTLIPTWTNGSGGSWPTTGNWTNGVIASGAGVVADFSRLNLTANATVTLDGARTIGGLKFSDTTPSHNWTLNTGTAGPLTLDVTSGSPVVEVANQTATIGAVVAGNDGLTKIGAGILTLSAVNTYTGDTTIQGGTLTLGGAGTLGGGSYAGAIANNGSFVINTSAAQVLTGLISGTGGITKSGSGALYNKGTNTYSGTTTISAGYLEVSQGELSIANSVLNVTSTDMRAVDIWAGKLTVRGLTGTGQLACNGGYNNGTGWWWNTDPTSLSINVPTGESYSFGGILKNATWNSGAKMTVAKAGAGTQILTGANTYTGTTTVTAGTLLVNGSLAASATTVQTGARLGGTGTIGGAVSSSGTLAPGNNAAGKLTVNNTLTLGTASSVAWEVSDWSGTAGTGYDNLTANSLNIAATSASPATITITQAALVNFSNVSKSFTLVQTTGGITGFDPAKFVINSAGFTAGTGTWSVQQAGNNLLLVYTRPNTAPSFATNPINLGATADAAFTGQLSANDPDPGESLTYSKVSGPAWLTVSPTGALTGTPTNSEAGLNTFTVSVTDTFNVQATATLNITVAATNPDLNGNGIRDDWEMTKFGNAAAGANLPNGDPDGDGLSNLLEYALDSHPLTPNKTTIVSNMAELPTGSHLRLTVPKNPLATNLTYIVETCGALNDWSAANTTVESDTSLQLVVRDNLSTSTSTRRFIRLRVVVNPQP